MHHKLFPVKLFQARLNPTTVMIYCNIFSHADGFHPIVGHIAQQTGLAKKTIYQHILILEQKNMMKVKRSVGKPNRYMPIDSEKWITEKSVCQEKPPKQCRLRGVVPFEGGSAVSGQKVVPFEGTGNRIDKNIYYKFSASLSEGSKKSLKIISDNSEKQDAKPKLHTGKNYSRVANQLAALFDSEGYDCKKIQGWALNLCKHFGYEQIESNIQRIYEDGIAGKFAKAKPNLNTCTHIANGSIFG